MVDFLVFIHISENSSLDDSSPEDIEARIYYNLETSFFKRVHHTVVDVS
jgi:hypothetical protein